jgi:putative Holliday junction resolvase
MPNSINASISEPATVMAFDYGTRRVGVAVGNSVSKSGQPLKTITAPNIDILFQEIGNLIAEWEPKSLVVGLPTHPDGTAHAMTAKAKRFGNQLHGRFGLPVTWVDERYTSVVLESDSQMRDNLDAHSAVLILEQFFVD